ncbi:sensor histidine kinase [Actinomadura rudentiformis]|uniref:Signal transduction histidine kinase subgroup 3 dimerisation and phosphoacceptor domain-containing protein n=1 Tax=Actinomadura rudentiformis TaxID=359158 RepID=A0A6H9Z973_9ACTN|nr:histidine kinase [Actinomadura rudentiformis]KAB2352205.1 hypothetical protein F8566_00365 [Actinomadura rudentiformis]
MASKPQVAWALVVGSLVALLAARVGFLFHPEVASQGVRAIAIMLILALFAVHALVLLRPQRRWSVSVEAVLTFAPYLVVGQAWGPVAGLLGSAVLLLWAAPASWLACALVIGGDTVIAALVFGDTALAALAGRLVIDVNVAIILFAVIRLAQRVQQAHAYRRELAALAVEHDRLGTARSLRSTIGTEISAIIGIARRLAPDTGPVPWDAKVAEIAERGRRALTAARRIADGHRRMPRISDGGAPVPDEFAFAWWSSVVIVIDYSAVALSNMAYERTQDARGWALTIAIMVVAGGLQLYHGAPRRGGATPRGWPLTLCAQLALLSWGVHLHGALMAPPLLLTVGAATLRVRPGWLPAAAAAGFLLVIAGPDETAALPYWFAGLVTAMIAVYALCRLPEVTQRLNETRNELARTAVAQARTQVSRDVHDLLGSGLSAIVLKGELAGRLLPADPARALGEVRDLQRIAERTLGEVRSITGVPAGLTLADELASARVLLEAAGVRFSAEAAVPDLAPAANGLVATIVREAVTNVVRHSSARHCHITCTVRDGWVRLRVTNDGLIGRVGLSTRHLPGLRLQDACHVAASAHAKAAPAPFTTHLGIGPGDLATHLGIGPGDLAGRRGTGLGNLAARATEAGGELIVHTGADLFTLTAQVPAGWSG